MMKRLMLLTLMLILTTAMARLPATAQQDAIHIPDDNLASAIREALQLEEGTPITAAAMRELTALEARGRGIADLGGLEHATNLTSLDLGGAYDVNGEWQTNPIEDIAALANLTQLEWLLLWDTAVSDVSPLANLTKLKTLDLSGTDVSDVSALANLTKLEWLNLGGTDVSDVSPLANLTQLKTLELYRTGVSDVSALANLTKLTGLNLRRTGVSDVSALANLTQLTTLSLYGTGVSDVSALANLTKLTGLGLVSTGVSDVSALANLTKLEWLNLTGTGVSDVSALANLTKLKTLSLTGTDVSDVSALANLTKLEWLNLTGTGVSDVSPLANLTQLKTLSLTGSPLSHASIHTHIPAMQAKGIWVSFDNVAHPALFIPDTNLASAIRKALQLDEEIPITAAVMRDLTELDAPGADIPSPEHFTNNLTSIADLTGLEHAINLTSLDLSGAWEIDAFVTNHISDISVLANLTQLTTLNLADTAVSDVSVLANLTQLTALNLSSTDVSDISVLANLTQLTALNLSSTDVSDISVLANLTQLTALNLTGTGVSDISVLANLTQLTTLELWGNAVSDVSVLANLTQLTALRLNETAVSDIAALANLTKLTQLSLADTAVSDIAALANLTKLTQLHLGGTAVSDVAPLLGLNLTGTSWSSIGLSLEGCPLSYASINTHIPAMQEKGIGVGSYNVAHPALLKVTGDTTLNTLVVEAMDENGEPIVGKTVLFENLQGGGTLSANTVETDARGRAQVTLTLGETAGSSKVKASAEGIQSWVLFNTVATETGVEATDAVDVNGDGVVDWADLVFVAAALGKPVQNPRADVNGNGQVDIEDLIAVAKAIDAALGAPALAQQDIETGSLQAADVQQWIRDAKAANADSVGIAALERLLAALTRVEAPPKETALLANYPNPFNPETWIPYQLAEPAEVEVSIYSADGKLVRTLELGQLPAGTYQNRSRAAYWDGRNAQGEPVASGVYFYTLTAGEFSATRKMVIRK